MKVIVDFNRDEILSNLINVTNHKEQTDRELVKIESRLEDRIIEVKTDLKSGIMQVRTDILQFKTDLEKDLREVKTDLKDDIKEMRNSQRTMTNLIITCGVGILAVIVTLILNIILK